MNTKEFMNQLDELASIEDNYAIVGADVLYNPDDRLRYYKIQKEDLNEVIGELIQRYYNLADENDKLTGENIRLNKVIEEVK